MFYHIYNTRTLKMDLETGPNTLTYIESPEVPNFSTLFPWIEHTESGQAKATGVPERKMEAGESSQRKRVRNGDQENNVKSERSIEALQSETGRKLMHSASERRRRNRIRQRFNTLKELIPDCSKTCDAEILEAAAAYMKSMQLHLQMMSITRYITGSLEMQGYDGVPWSPAMHMIQQQWTCQPQPSQATVAMGFPEAYEALPMIQLPMQYFNPFQQYNQ